MNLNTFFKSVIDADEAAVVICDLAHTIVYMNPSAIARYSKSGGAALMGSSLLDCHNDKANEKIKEVVAWFAASEDHNKVFTFHNVKENKDVYMIALRDENGALIGYYEKHEYRNPETAQRYSFK